MSLWRNVYFAGPFSRTRCQHCGTRVVKPMLPSLLTGIPGTLFVIMILLGYINTLPRLAVGAIAVVAIQSVLQLMIPLMRSRWQ